MAYEIAFNSDLELIQLKFRSPDTLEEHLSATREIHDLSIKHNNHRVLVDLYHMDLPTQLTITEQHQFTEQWNPELYKNCVFAIVLPEKTDLQDDWYFIIHLIKLAGTQGQPFYSLEEAIKWLTAGKTNQSAK